MSPMRTCIWVTMKAAFGRNPWRPGAPLSAASRGHLPEALRAPLSPPTPPHALALTGLLPQPRPVTATVALRGAKRPSPREAGSDPSPGRTLTFSAPPTPPPPPPHRGRGTGAWRPPGSTSPHPQFQGIRGSGTPVAPVKTEDSPPPGVPEWPSREPGAGLGSAQNAPKQGSCSSRRPVRGWEVRVGAGASSLNGSRKACRLQTRHRGPQRATATSGLLAADPVPISSRELGNATGEGTALAGRSLRT